MKKEYVRPMMVGERFAPNEYVAACGDSGTTYLFKCDAGGGTYGSVYLESNNVEGLQTTVQWIQTGDNIWDGTWQKPDDCIAQGNFHACPVEHEVDSQNAFLNGYYIPNGSSDVTNVIIWRGPDGRNVHCTTKLNMNDWETAKSQDYNIKDWSLSPVFFNAMLDIRGTIYGINRKYDDN